MIESGEVKLHFLDYWRVIKMRAGLIILVFLLVMVTAGITTYFLPRRYLAQVTIEVRPDDFKSVSVDGGRGRAYDPQFVATQFQILRKAEIIDPVIERLDLVKVYSGDGQRLPLQQVFGMVAGSLDLQEVRNTGLIEVGVWHTKPEMAANIANTLVTEYREHRMVDLQKSLDRGLSQFQDEVTRQRKVVEDYAREAARIRVADHIVDPDPENSNSVIVSNDPDFQRTEAAVNEQRLKVEQIKTALEEIRTLKPEALKEALHQLGIDDPGVATNLAQLQQSRLEEVNYLNSGVGENHPRIKALRARMVTSAQILNESLEGIRRAEETKLKLEQSTLTALLARQEETRQQAIEGRDKTANYVDAKTKYLQAKHILEAAEVRLSNARMEKVIDIDPVKIWQKAEPPMGPAWPPVKQYLIGAGLVGILVGVLLAFFIEYLDTSVKTIDDVERFLQTTVLAVIPKGIPMLLKIRGDHADAEAYRILRANIEFNKPSGEAKTMTLISAGPGEGKSTTLNNLAFTCAKGGYNVLVVDADLRRPTQHTFFDTENAFGLTDYLLGKATVDAITRTTKIDNLSFIPSGILPSDAVGILNSQPMTQLIDRVKSQYDLILFDSPPILGVSDGSVLASEMDMTVMVVQHRRFPRAMLQRVKQAVQQVGGCLVGVVLNNVDTRHDSGYSYYNAYQDYYATPRREATPRAAAPAVASPASKPRRTVGVATPQRNGDNGDAGEY